MVVLFILKLKKRPLFYILFIILVDTSLVKLYDSFSQKPRHTYIGSDKPYKNMNHLVINHLVLTPMKARRSCVHCNISANLISKYTYKITENQVSHQNNIRYLDYSAY